MPLTGQAKTDYQRDYMRKRRSNQRSNAMPESVRPVTQQAVRPKTTTTTPSGPTTTTKSTPSKPKLQSYNPMMVGYVPPTD